MEWIICNYKQLTTALEQSARLSDTQFGFHTQLHSTLSTLLLSAVHEWSLCLELYIIVFIGFCEGF